MAGRDTLVLCYHALSSTWTANLSVTPAAFRAQLHSLHRAGYRGVTFTEASQQRAPGKRVAITFDDAFVSVVTHAKPVLDELGWPGTVYAVSDYAETGRPLDWEGVGDWSSTPDAHELASLDWAALRVLRDSGWEIGSHTVTHPRLTTTDDRQLASELRDSRAAVEAALDAPCTSIAYPYGDVDARVVAAASEAGYATAAALPRRWNQTGALERPRIGIWHHDTQWRFRLKTARLARTARGTLNR